MSFVSSLLLSFTSFLQRFRLATFKQHHSDMLDLEHCAVDFFRRVCRECCCGREDLGYEWARFFQGETPTWICFALAVVVCLRGCQRFGRVAYAPPPPFPAVFFRFLHPNHPEHTPHHKRTYEHAYTPTDAHEKQTRTACQLQEWPDTPEAEFRKYLGRFGLSGQLATMPMKNLSGGQKSRACFAEMSLRHPHIVLFGV